MLVTAKSHVRPRHYRRQARWRRGKEDRQVTRVPEEKYSNLLIDHLNLGLTNLLNVPLWTRHQIDIPAVDAPTRFGRFGGQFAPELQMSLLLDLPSVFHSIISDDSFWADFSACPLTSPSALQLARNLTQAAGGANIWLKREDLNAYGSYQTRNIVGQILFARYVGKTEIAMDCGLTGHGLVCATMCARMNMKCTILMGASDIAAQPDGVEKMERLGANVISVQCTIKNDGSGTLRAAANEALRYSLKRLDSTYHITTGTVGPHPLPTITRTFQSLLGQEIKNCAAKPPGNGFNPSALISAIGPSGSAALGMFAPFVSDPRVRFIAVEAAGAAPLTHGSVGVMYGCKTLMLQDDSGQILPSHSISPDLNFSCAGPELAHWKDIGRLETVTASSEEAVQGLRILAESEGIVSGLATGHAVLETVRVARQLGAGRDVVLLVSG
ncbi:hypothetical protein BDW74DRAFT_100659 [Aspergillus multicolor]|uniref:tryptophan synthase n=1 Tax=Aspergillus multicolor TaxID=41759 RepID=UPI003CCD2420